MTPCIRGDDRRRRPGSRAGPSAGARLGTGQAPVDGGANAGGDGDTGVRLSGAGRPGGRHGPRPGRGLSGGAGGLRGGRRALGEELSRLVWEGEIAELTLTRNAQPALMATSIAAMRALEAEGVAVTSAAFVAGHSLGEYSALCAAGALRLDDTARLLRLRGQAMQEAVPVGRGGDGGAARARPRRGRGGGGGGGAGGGVCEAANDNDPARWWCREPGGGRAGGGDRQGQGRQAGAAAAGERAVPLRADAAGGGRDGRGAGGGGDRGAVGAAGGERQGRGGDRSRGDPRGCWSRR